MNPMNPITFLFYNLKPLIPRRLQILLRRQITMRRRKSSSHIWPIDPNAGKSPENWPGWPDGKKFAVVLSHDVDTLRGHENCRWLIEVEKKLGFRSMVNFVPERYPVSAELRNEILKSGMEVGVHGLKHDGKLFFSQKIFNERAIRINQYLKEWGARGFTSPSAHHNLSWMHALNIDYDISTFDTDPFEPQPDGVATIFPFIVYKDKDILQNCPGVPKDSSGVQPRQNNEKDLKGVLGKGFVELPYTLPQDFTLFILMREKTIDIWKKKLDWIAEKGGMALLNTHPDYMSFNDSDQTEETYSVKFFTEFLEYIKNTHEGRYWHVLPGEMAQFCRSNI